MYQKMPRATQLLPIYSLSLSVASILCSNISSSLKPSMLSLIAWNCLLLFQNLMACQWRAPPWSAWSAERGARPCWRAPVCPVPLATGRLPALWPWGKQWCLLLTFHSNGTCDEDRATHRSGFMGKDGRAAYRWQAWTEETVDKDPSISSGSFDLTLRIFWSHLEDLWPHLEDLWPHLEDLLISPWGSLT